MSENRRSLFGPSLEKKGTAYDSPATMTPKLGPWRITFDTNPDDCNLRCIMCECFSPYSPVKRTD